MPEQIIVCPYCRREIPLSEAITHSIREEIQKEFEKELTKRQEELAKKEEFLLKKEKAISQEIVEKLAMEKARIEAEMRKQLEDSFNLRMKDLEEELKHKNEQLEEMRKTELHLRKERRDLEERQKLFELEITRRLDEEREKIRQEAQSRIAEEYRLKDLEKDKKINDLLRDIEELKRKAEQGPIHLKGEVLEIELEDLLKDNFPMDQIEPVSKGKKGADIIQRVHNQLGQYCGTIIWEAKRTKNWNEGWIDKLKEDQRETRAEIAVIATTAMPKEVNSFKLIDGVWVTEYSLAPCLATALRMNLIQLANEKRAAMGKHEKMEALYSYLNGPEFKQKVEAIVTAFLSMKNDLESEKAVMNRIWAKREKQIERVIKNITRMYGDMQGIIGASLPEIKSLEFKTLIDSEEPEP